LANSALLRLLIAPSNIQSAPPAPLPAATPAATPHNPHTALPSPAVPPSPHSHIRHIAAQTRALLFPSTIHHSRCGASLPPAHAPALLPAAASPATMALAPDRT